MTPDYSLLLPGTNSKVRATVLLHHLHGAMDAGHAGRGLIEHLVDTLPAKTVATFNSDLLIDFRSHRPWLRFEDWHFSDLEMPEIKLDLLSDDNDTNFLVLHGPEPDARWNAFVQTVLDLARTMGVKQIVGVAGMPAGVPHTRPTPVHMHGSNPKSLPQQPRMQGEMTIPAGMDQLLEYALGEAGFDSLGIIAAVPYYLAEGDYPPAAAAIMQAVVSQTGLALPVGDVEAAATVTLGQINQMVDQASEAKVIVEMLEKNFDEAKPDAIIETKPEPLPTADELGARLEEFLERSDRLSRGLQLKNLDRDFEKNSNSGLSSLRETPYERRDIDPMRPKRRPRHRKDVEED
ncbi:PAC2 family protein [Mobiluncus mulieris]|uniref:PAC2 family protein n=1 Tax=Mobiluncus mulieris TaxID=2052 RepID=UPI0021E2D34F|nr:PAC2 family protein [Mobiluncus mulieris]MCU9993338.1 PAC2 family protein [Mobiluncus mulieris]